MYRFSERVQRWPSSSSSSRRRRRSSTSRIISRPRGLAGERSSICRISVRRSVVRWWLLVRVCVRVLVWVQLRRVHMGVGVGVSVRRKWMRGVWVLMSQQGIDNARRRQGRRSKSQHFPVPLAFSISVPRPRRTAPRSELPQRLPLPLHLPPLIPLPVPSFSPVSLPLPMRIPSPLPPVRLRISRIARVLTTTRKDLPLPQNPHILLPPPLPPRLPLQLPIPIVPVAHHHVSVSISLAISFSLPVKTVWWRWKADADTWSWRWWRTDASSCLGWSEHEDRHRSRIVERHLELVL